MVQIDSKEYFSSRYNDLKRFVSYFYQVDLTQKTSPKKILEIGIGNSIVSNYLKSKGYAVTTFDFDISLKPDVVGDIRTIEKHFKMKEFDTVVCFEVLEHIPLKEVEGVLKQLREITRKYLIISVPHTSLKASFGFKFPFMERKDFLISIPYRQPHKFDGEHYWELGKKGFGLRKIRKIIRDKFRIVKEIRPALNPYHRFFVLEKR